MISRPRHSIVGAPAIMARALVFANTIYIRITTPTKLGLSGGGGDSQSHVPAVMVDNSTSVSQQLVFRPSSGPAAAEIVLGWFDTAWIREV